MYKITCDDVQFIGYEESCWKFIVGFLGFDMRERHNILEITDFDGKRSSYGVISVFEFDC